jgi:8-oxo-dGTP pyrophosphatase MutT (NUDIX family)
MITVEDIRRCLAERSPRLLADERKTQAAVAAVLHEDSGTLRLLFIERSKREGDPWSGHIAFPGGKVEPGDREPRCAAERETLEEIGLDLAGTQYLGRLDDLTGATLPVLVAGFVYLVESPGPFALNDEVREVFWVPVGDLADPGRQVACSFHYHGADHVHPAIDLLGPGRPVLWGLTYRFVGQFLQLGGYQMPQIKDR